MEDWEDDEPFDTSLLSSDFEEDVDSDVEIDIEQYMQEGGLRRAIEDADAADSEMEVWSDAFDVDDVDVSSDMDAASSVDVDEVIDRMSAPSRSLKP